jgi:integral membrane protein (TIGR01906 family)
MGWKKVLSRYTLTVMNKKSLLLAILIPLVLFTINIFIILFVFNSAPNFLISNKAYSTQHTKIISFLFTGKDTEIRSVLPEDELNHIKDVQRVIKYSAVTLLIIVIFIIYLIKRSSTTNLINSIKYSLILLPFLAICILILFEPVFILFHKVFFPQGNWSFPENSILIQLYPEGFWIWTTGILLAMTIIELEIMRKLLKTRHKNELH